MSSTQKKSKVFTIRNGRSIEEVIMKRKVDGSDPSSWPEPPRRHDGSSVLSKSMSNLGAQTNLVAQNLDQSRSSNNLRNNETSFIHKQSQQDKIDSSSYFEDSLKATLIDQNAKMQSLMEYCRVMQKRVQELEGELVVVKYVIYNTCIFILC